ncbi:ankyrin repeat domain-containing protein [Candidatus Rickettsia colombianensi]|uniref:ankyrin repeat domain-containing protein n=1 Tax=Candidatus Rickettsia colombianensi TaxID=1090944 RepID=UPI0015AE3B76|nr:ankyrin repeat domain-containing protein [Candidatus Rickettsia colombianensi]
MKNLTTYLIKEYTLIEAVRKDNFQEVKYLVSQDVDLNFHDENLDTVFSIAAYHGQIRILEYLATNMKKTSVNI